MPSAGPKLRWLIVSSLLLASGCTAITDPLLRDWAGTFVLQSVDGAPLPVLKLDYTTTRQYLLADTLWADGRGHYARASIFETDSVGRPYRAIQRTMQTGTYQVTRGDTVEFASTCPPYADCIAPPVGWRANDSEWIIAQRQAVGFAFVSIFRRID